MVDSNEIDVFPWNRNFEIGIEVIDDQHKVLVSLTNQLALSLANQGPELETDKLLTELFEYAEYHFSTEEKVWEEVLDSDVSVTTHQTSHQNFISQITDIKTRFEQNRTTSIQNDILSFLINWLAHHILEEDMMMAKTISALKSGLGLDEAKSKAAEEMSGTTHIFIETLLMMYGRLSSRTVDLLRERNLREGMRKELEQEKQNEKIFSDHVMRSIPGLLYVYDANKKLVRWNEFHETVLGYTSSELEGKPVDELFSETPDLEQILEDVLKGQHVQFEQCVMYQDGRNKTYMMTAIPFEINGSKGFLGTGINISKLKAVEAKLEKEANETKQALKGTILSVINAMEAKDSYTAGHQRNVAKIAVAIARKLELEENQIEGIELGALIHDIGKMAIPTELLVKPNKLQDIEFELIKTHSSAGVEILEDVKFPWPITDIVSQHHERLDGTGYPSGLKGGEICIEARIVAVADVFEAMSSHRPYRPALGPEIALEELKKYKGLRYDEKAVEALSNILEGDINFFQSQQ